MWLFSAAASRTALNARFVPSAAWPGVLGLALVVLGLGFATWARVYLGRNWSAAVTLKRDHELVRSGPYRWVRNPIYTGILLAVYATAALKGTVPGIAGAAIITLGLWMKARLEEDWLRQELDAGAYDSYRRRVPMLLPFGPSGA